MNEILSSVRVPFKGYSRAAAAIRARSSAPPAVVEAVERIVEDVRKKGDAAVLRYAKSLDGAVLGQRGLRIPKGEIDAAVGKVPTELTRALRVSLGRIRRVQESILRRAESSITCRGFSVKVIPKPLLSVGCYVPGGRAAYASTVLMTAGLAKLAGVQRVAICTPAGRDGRVNSAILAAASLVGVDEVYRVGGAQAIAAMAYGTSSIRRVDKIVGPGGRYVAAAKRCVAGDVATDFYAGPTELIVLADESCDPVVAGWELIGQAEHGEETLCGLVTFTERYAARVRRAIKEALPGLQRRNFVEASLRRGFAAVCADGPTAFNLVDAIAPEHLEIMTGNPAEADAKIRGAGLKLIGKNTPCAASDYLVGTDHVVPTAGLASGRGPLSALDFVKLDWSVKGSAAGLTELLPALKAMAEAEGLPNHYLSTLSRFGG